MFLHWVFLLYKKRTDCPSQRRNQQKRKETDRQLENIQTINQNLKETSQKQRNVQYSTIKTNIR